MKTEKTMYSKNMANFEAFLRAIKLSINLLFLKSCCTITMIQIFNEMWLRVDTYLVLHAKSKIFWNRILIHTTFIITQKFHLQMHSFAGAAPYLKNPNSFYVLLQFHPSWTATISCWGIGKFFRAAGNIFNFSSCSSSLKKTTNFAASWYTEILKCKNSKIKMCSTSGCTVCLKG